MQKHRGKIIEKLIKDKGTNVQEIAESLSIGRTTLYRWMSDPNLSLKKMNKVADLFNTNRYTFSQLVSDGVKSRLIFYQNW